MKAVLLKGPKQVELVDIPVPQITDDEVLVEVKYCGICGTDPHAYEYCEIYQPLTYMGHEFSGVLAKVGNNVKGWKPGDRVAVYPLYICGECSSCQHGRWSTCEHAVEYGIGVSPGLENAGAFAKYVKVSIPERRLYRLPDNVSFEAGALIEPLAVSLHSVRMSGIRCGENAAVLGAGVIGLGVVSWLKNVGAGKIIVIEISKKRGELARKLGADYVFNPLEEPDLGEKVRALTDGEGVEVAFECSGNPAAFKSAISVIKRGGQVLLTGMIDREVPIIPSELVFNEWRIQGSLCYHADEFPLVIKALEKGILPTEDIITSKIKLDDIVDTFKSLLKPDSNNIKVLVEPSE